MARSNTPVSYKCGFCVKLGHNARTCPDRNGNVKSDAQKLKEQRAEKRVIREARKAEKEAKKILRSSPIAILEEIEQMLAEAKAHNDITVIREIEAEENECNVTKFDVAFAATDERPIVDIPPVLSKIGDTTYVVSGSVRVPVPEDTAFDEIAAFVQYIPHKPTTNGISLFRNKRNVR